MADFRSDRLIMRDYITAKDHLQYTQLPDGIVAILLTHSNLQANHVDIRLDLHLSIADVKGKFRTHIGTHVEHQRLILKDHGVWMLGGWIVMLALWLLPFALLFFCDQILF